MGGSHPVNSDEGVWKNWASPTCMHCAQPNFWSCNYTSPRPRFAMRSVSYWLSELLSISISPISLSHRVTKNDREHTVLEAFLGKVISFLRALRQPISWALMQHFAASQVLQIPRQQRFIYCKLRRLQLSGGCTDCDIPCLHPGISISTLIGFTYCDLQRLYGVKPSPYGGCKDCDLRCLHPGLSIATYSGFTDCDLQCPNAGFNLRT